MVASARRGVNGAHTGSASSTNGFSYMARKLRGRKRKLSTSMAPMLLATGVCQPGPVPTFETFDGLSLYYDDQGRGQPVMLLHGFAADTNLNWVRSGIFDALVDQGYRVL